MGIVHICVKVDLGLTTPCCDNRIERESSAAVRGRQSTPFSTSVVPACTVYVLLRTLASEQRVAPSHVASLCWHPVLRPGGESLLQDLSHEKQICEQGTEMDRRVKIVDQLRTDGGLC